ncbi:MAG: 2-hydroxymuconate tautomerase family protein [Rickettsiaceae bacterium]
MPIVQIHLMHGRDATKKRQLVNKVTQAICESLEVEPKNVRIILSEMIDENYAIAGELVRDQKDPFGKSAK